MNKYKMPAFVVFGLMMLALVIGAFYGQAGLTFAAVFALAVALLTLDTTLNLIYMSLQGLCVVLAGACHVVAVIADEVADWSRTQRELLATRSDNVPEWGSSALVQVTGPDATDTSSFMDTTFDHQNA